MNINDAFPSKYLKSSDIPAAGINLAIASAVIEDIERDRKLIMYFKGAQKGMVLNKTNANILEDAYGSETDDWTGKVIRITVHKVSFQGRPVDGMHVTPSDSLAPTPIAQAPSTNAVGITDDDIPF